MQRSGVPQQHRRHTEVLLLVGARDAVAATQRCLLLNQELVLRKALSQINHAGSECAQAAFSEQPQGRTR